MGHRKTITELEQHDDQFLLMESAFLHLSPSSHWTWPAATKIRYVLQMTEVDVSCKRPKRWFIWPIWQSFWTRNLNVGFSFETTACASLDYKLVHTKETLTKEQTKIASNVSNEGIEVIQPVLKWVKSDQTNIFSSITLSNLFFDLILSIWDPEWKPKRRTRSFVVPHHNFSPGLDNIMILVTFW